MAENILDIRDGVLVQCTVNNPELIIPEEVVRIPHNICARNKVLKKLTVLGKADIGSEAFFACKNLEEVYLTEGVKSIGYRCFALCEKLQELYIPQSVEMIDDDIACMEAAENRHPIFYCHRFAEGEKWSPYWNRIFHDPRFGDERSHMFFHPAYFGTERDGTPRKDQPTVQEVTGTMPHSTGQKLPHRKGEESKRIPPITLRLRLDATRITITHDKEFALRGEEYDVIPRLIRAEGSSVKREMGKSWKIRLNDDTRQLAPELKIHAEFNNYLYPFDGSALTICHDTPDRGLYDSFLASELREGETIVAEKYVTNGNSMDIFDVRLFIEWPKQRRRRYTIEQVFATLLKNQTTWNQLDPEKHEIAVHLAHGDQVSSLYKRYTPINFPKQFIADLTNESEQWKDLEYIEIIPCEVYKKWHEYSEDMRLVYGIDRDEGWTEIVREPIGKRSSFEIQR